MSVAALVPGSPLVTAQRDPRPLGDHRRVPGFAEMTSVFDFEPVFHGNVPQAVYDYTAHGADSEFTIRRNRDAFDWVDVVPRAPIDSAAVDTRTTVLGLNLDESRAMLDRVHGAGCQAIVVTVDQQATFYERTQHLRNLGGSPRTPPARPATGGPSNPYRVPDTRLWYEWRYLEQIRPFIAGPMLVKGISSACRSSRRSSSGPSPTNACVMQTASWPPCAAPRPHRPPSP